jgi:putative redox protein
MAEPHRRAPIVVTHEGGLRFGIQIRSHRILVDQPERAGGEDAGPTPLELIAASLGSCVSLYVHQFCESRGLSSEGLRVEVDSIGASNPGRIGELTVRVWPPAELPAHAAALLERVARSCPAHNTLQHGATVTVEIESVAARETVSIGGTA